MKRLPIDVWSDIACPWCYVGKRRLEAALQRFAHADAVDVTWRAFELDPAAPRVRDSAVSYAERLGKKYGRSTKEAQGMIDQMTQVARDDGLDFHFERVQSGNTFDAHRVLHLARTKGTTVQGAVKERLLRGYMTEGEAIGEPEVLVRLAAEAGLDAAEVRAMLASDLHADDVREEERDAQRLGIRGVPFFVIGRKWAVSGAQPAELLLSAIEKAWSELGPELETIGEGATVCGPDGCV
jgi:predicted DsbA family dithiol-disulfide isomerase